MSSIRKIAILDTTLRDGEQAPGFGMNREQKLEVARQLERLKVDVIEAGFPISSKEDLRATREIAKTIKDCGVAGFGRAIIGDVSCSWEAVKHAVRPRLHIFLATSDIHIQHKLHLTRERILELAVESVTYARGLCPEVQFTAEDATRSNVDFLLEVFRRVTDAGASVVNIADTVGYSTPGEIAELVRRCKGELSGGAQVSIHCHDDLGMAAANTLAAIKAGADQAETAINGIGERAGMAALEEIVMALRTRGDYYGADTGVVTRQFYRASKLLCNTVDMALPPNKAIVGANAFAHQAGVHQHGMMSNPLTYEIMKPSDVGVYAGRFVLGKHSGKAALRERLEELGHTLDDDALEEFFLRFKKLASRKKIVSDQDLEKLLLGEVRTRPRISLVRFVVNSGSDITSTAVVKLRQAGEEVEMVACGESPVIAAFKAVDLIVKQAFPLQKWSIQSISEGRTELGESAVQIRHGEHLVTGRGIDTDIVTACIKAYVSAINLALDAENGGLTAE